jgi:hypothetical protein
MSRALWQISGGPTSRAYAEVFLKHGVALIGPGDAGAWTRERDDDEFEGGFVRRFELRPRTCSCCIRGSRRSPRWGW